MTDLVGDLLWLVDTPSETGDEDLLCGLLAERLGSRFQASEVRRVGNSLIVGRDTGRPQIALYGHLDTVPEQGNRPGRVEADRMVGLGTSDMKAGLAVMIGLLEDEDIDAGPFDLVAVFYDREEGPAADNGLEEVLDSVPRLLESEFAIVMEPTDNELQLGCQGAINAVVTFEGRSAHSSRPWFGENAITKAGAWMAAMHRLEPVEVEVSGLVFRETFTVTTAHGGLARNVVPSRFEVNINHRFPPDSSVEDAEQRLREKCAGADSVEVVDIALPAPVPEGNAHLERLKSISGAPVTAKQAWTDVARLTARGVPAVNFGPGETAQAHSATESVALENLDYSFRALHRFLVEV